MARQQNRRRLVSNELLEHAARLFATQGYANTSFQDIADAMGISRPALYHYVSNKEEILAALVRDVLERVVEILEEARAREDLSADARVAEALRRIVINNARNTTRFRLLDRSEPDLPAEIADLHRQARRRVLELLTGMIEDATHAGRFRPLPARTVALGMLGMANWVAWWYRPGRDEDAESIADALVELAMSGVRRDDDRQVAPGPWAALALVKEDLAHLEKTLSAVLDTRPDQQ
ncbi:transcriptional regulator, TetR family [Pseudonocardia thermophila]|jgi:Transcriptional regulator|uniref:Transcriptional regulator, TetR family n=1 Tax=Pseudonocardia thermophila TaxID=1848 RepID=A0A1M6RWG1_PSETH|nr:TetR/AcrR family transcriptional regulator [Pseudonocardia thermophila]SHK36832.1 transcriptional regulator, TetR family [Pseudonocardia thermophila]